jgi:hypothetical protein
MRVWIFCAYVPGRKGEEVFRHSRTLVASANLLPRIKVAT